MTTVTFNAPQRVGVPFFSSLLVKPVLHVLSWFTSDRPARARTPDLASRIADAARVRRMAQALMDDDPRFASDLLAAADRHEFE